MNRTVNSLLAAALLMNLAGCKPNSKPPATGKPEAKTEPAASSESAAAPAKKIDLLAELPAAAQKAIKEQVGDGEILSVEDAGEDNDPAYAVEMKKGDKTRSFTVNDDGTLLSYQVFESELPPKVLSIFRSEFGSADLGEIFRETEDGETAFTAELIAEGRTNALSVVEDASSWTREIIMSQAPAAVQATVKKVWAAMEPTEVSKVFADGETTFEVVAEKDGLEQTLVIGADGKVLSRENEMKLAMTPGPVQTAIKRRFGAQDELSILQAADSDGVTYTVTGTKDGQELELNISPTGQIISSSVE